MKILDLKISSPLKIKIAKGMISILHPSFAEMSFIISQLSQEDLDLRRLAHITKISYPCKGVLWLKRQWQKVILTIKKNHPNTIDTCEQIIKQSEGILNYKSIPTKNSKILDPFNMRIVESKASLKKIITQQLSNTIIAKASGIIIGVGRLLEVENSVEIVSLWTQKEWRRNGIATRIIEELLRRTRIRPIYSFQNLNFVPFYLKRYSENNNAYVCTFDEIPPPLQRDLFYMNNFWGPYIIIKIDSKN